MNDIIRMAREAGFTIDESLGVPYALLNEKTLLEFNVALERFAALVAAAERKECARICCEHWLNGGNAMECADAIRARRQV